MGERTVIRIELSVFGDELVAEEFSSIIGLTPTRTGIKGNEIPPIDSPAIRSQSKRYFKDTFWDFSSERFETLFLDEITGVFLDNFAAEKLPIAMRYIQEKNLQTQISIIAEMAGETTPALCFNRRFLDFAHAINAEIDVDLYDFLGV